MTADPTLIVTDAEDKLSGDDRHRRSARLVPRPERSYYVANWILGRVVTHLSLYSMSGHGGSVLPGQSFRCVASEPERVCRPDVAFVLADRVPAVRPRDELTDRPDVAIEVVSPDETVGELESKLEAYRAGHVPLVWCFHPAVRLVRIFTGDDRHIRELFDGDTLRGDPVLPGFAVAVADLFPPRTPG